MMVAALLVIDVQQGFLDSSWGPTTNLECEDNIRSLLTAWRASGFPVILVRHDSVDPTSPLRPGQSGNDFMPDIDGPHDLLVVKSVNSAFYGQPDLHVWLGEQGITELVITGITTNHCCETTARMAGNLGYQVSFVLDATRTFDRTTPDGRVVNAEELMRVTAANLHKEFAEVTSTARILARLNSQIG